MHRDQGGKHDDPGDRFVFIPSEQDRRACNKMLSSIVVPRPIAMVSTVSETGNFNVAPYSYYQPITWSPMLVGIAIGLRGADRRADSDATGFKDTYLNAMTTRDFVINVTTAVFRGAIENAATEFPRHVSEFEHVPWTPIPSLRVRSPSVAEAPARLECTVHEVFDLGSPDGAVKYVVGEVQCVVVDPSMVIDGIWVDDLALQPIGRLGGRAFLQTIPGAVYEEQRISLLPEYRDH